MGCHNAVQRTQPEDRDKPVRRPGCGHRAWCVAGVVPGTVKQTPACEGSGVVHCPRRELALPLEGRVLDLVGPAVKPRCTV